MEVKESFDEFGESKAVAETFNLRQYWQIANERRWLVISVFLIAVIFTVISLFASTHIYASKTRLQIDREEESALRMEAFVMEGGSREQDYMQTQYKNIQSRTLMEIVLKQILQNVSILDAMVASKDTPQSIADETGMAVEEVIKRLDEIDSAGFFSSKYEGGKIPDLRRGLKGELVSGLFVFPEKIEGEKKESPSYEKMLKRISKSISVVPIRLSRLVDIIVESPNYNEAAMIANTVVLNFLEMDNSRKRGKLSNAIRFLKEEATNLSNAVHTNNMALHSFKLKWDIISLEESQNTTLQALLKAQADYSAANSKRVELNTVADEAIRIYNETKKYETIPEVESNSTIKEIRSKLVSAESELASLLERYLNKHPKIIEKRRAIAVFKESLITAEKRVFDSLNNQARLARVTDDELAAVLTIRKAEQQSINQKSIEYNSLDRKTKQAETMYNLALQRLKETELQEKDIVQNMHIVDLAIPQLNPIKPNKSLIVLLGVSGGLLAGLGLAIFVNFLDDSIKSQEDIESFLKLPFLGYVPNIKTTSIIERDMQAHLHPQSNSAEAFRTIRAAIALSPRGNQVQVLAVTSTIPSEGKSLVASNHAIVTAQTGAKTLLVDCDLRRPSVHKAFQIQSPRGLTSYLLGREESIDSISHQTEVPNLDIICCGAVPNNPSELAGSQRMLDFIAEVRAKYEKVIFDCPPVSAVSDPLIIASGADGTVFVNKFNKIRRDHALKTVQRVQDAGINIIGVCINDLDFKGKDSYYYSYYYYQNRYYASHYKSDKEVKTNEEGSDIAVQPGVQRQGQSKAS